MPKFRVDAPQRAGKAQNAEAQWRREQSRARVENLDNLKSEFRHVNPSGAGLMGRCLDTMYNVFNPGQRVRFEQPDPEKRKGAGTPVFGKGRGTSYRGTK